MKPILTRLFCLAIILPIILLSCKQENKNTETKQPIEKESPKAEQPIQSEHSALLQAFLKVPDQILEVGDALGEDSEEKRLNLITKEYDSFLDFSEPWNGSSSQFGKLKDANVYLLSLCSSGCGNQRLYLFDETMNQIPGGVSTKAIHELETKAGLEHGSLSALFHPTKNGEVVLARNPEFYEFQPMYKAVYESPRLFFEPNNEIQQGLAKHLASIYGKADVSQLTDSERVFQTWTVDLNGDGEKERIFTARNMDFCGSGGCTFWIINTAGETISKWTVSDLPIHIREQKTNGWNDIAIWSNGAHRLLQFDGKSYPSNPSTASEISESELEKGTLVVFAEQ